MLFGGGAITFLYRVGDRELSTRHATTIEFLDTYKRVGRYSDEHGVKIRPADGRVERLESDTLHDRFANTGAHAAEASGWRDRIVAVELEGRTIDVGESVHFELALAAMCLVFVGAGSWTTLRARRR